MKNVFFIAFQDARNQLKQKSTLIWLFVMPPVFFYFIGTVTGGANTSMSGSQATPIVVVASAPGFLKDQIDLRLRDNDFIPTWYSQLEDRELEGDQEQAPPRRVLSIEDKLSDRVIAAEQVAVSFDTKSSALRREFEVIRVQRSLYTALGDIVVAKSEADGNLTAADLVTLNGRTRVWQLEVSPAGARQEIPSGFAQTVPGILVMFTLLILLTSGATMLVLERKHGLLRRLASAPISRAEVVSGKWGGRMLLAVVQVAAAFAVGTFLFNMDWGPDFAMIVVVLMVWAGFCASAGMLLGTLANTEQQASGLGVLFANGLAALGGCWWPIEVTPAWMQTLQNFTPTGWAMDALHKLISFQSGPASVLPQLAILLVATVILAAIATRRFQYQ